MMQRLAVLAALSLVPAGAMAQSAPPPTWVQSVTSRSCEMSSTFPAATMTLSASLDDPTMFHLKLSGISGAPVAGTTGVTLQSDAGSQSFLAAADGQSLIINLDSSNFRQFLHDFTAGTSMSILSKFATPVQLNLTGTSEAVSALGQCTEADDFQQLPEPWHAPTSGEVAAASAEMIYHQTMAPVPGSGNDQSNQTPPQQVQSAQLPAPPASPAPTPAAEPAAPAAVAPAQPSVDVTALTCSIGDMGPVVQGLLVNNTGVSQTYMQVVEVFLTQAGSFVSTTSTYATYNPVLPGQTSPFSDVGGENPVIAKVQISTADEEGAELPTSGQTTVSCDSGSPSS